MSVLTTSKNLLRLYSDQLLKAQGDIKNNPHLTKESIEYLNKHGVMVRKTVYKNHELAQSTKVFKMVHNFQDLLPGDELRLTTKQGKITTGVYTRKIIQANLGVKTEYLEFIEPNGSKGYAALNLSVKIEKKVALASESSLKVDQVAPISKGLTLQESINALRSLDCDVYSEELKSQHGSQQLDLLKIFQETKTCLEKATNNRVSIKPENVKVEVIGNQLNFSLSANGFELDRRVDLDQKVVDNHYFKLDEEYQNADLGKTLFRVLHEQYLAYGIKKITVSANVNVGGYSWMAYGFSSTVTQAEELVEDFSYEVGHKYKLVDKQNSNKSLARPGVMITQDDVDRLTTAINVYKLKNPDQIMIPMNILASASKNKLGESVFKAWLIFNEKSWRGELKLTDPDQKAYFETYIGYNK